MTLTEPVEVPKNDGRGSWKDGVHVLAPRDERMELKLFGTADDKETQHTGINFDKYENIPVETKGDNVPPCIEKVCCKKKIKIKRARLKIFFNTEP